MDVFDAIEISQQAKGWVRRAGSAAGALLIAGWVWRWPVIHPFVQHVLDRRVAEATELYTSMVERYVENLGSG